jgi:hypothetical protein
MYRKGGESHPYTPSDFEPWISGFLRISIFGFDFKQHMNRIVVPLSICLLAPICPTSPPLQQKGDVGVAYQIPFRLTDTLHILVRAKIDGKGPFNFIVDTGAPALFIATDVAKKLEIVPDKNGWATIARLELEGGAVIPDAKARIETPFQLEGMNGIGLAGATLHGIIGYTVLARYRMELDFTTDRMTWTRLDHDPTPPQGMNKGSAPAGLDALGGVMKLMGSLMGKKPETVFQMRGFLGFEFAEVDQGVTVTNVLPGSPADQAGLKANDRLVQFQDKPVTSAASLLRHAAAVTPGKSVRMTVTRDGTRQEIRIGAGTGF